VSYSFGVLYTQRVAYSTLVTRDSVRLAFLLAALNGLDVLAGDVQNAYINADSKENLASHNELGQVAWLL
jgi:hypothetical protein